MQTPTMLIRPEDIVERIQRTCFSLPGGGGCHLYRTLSTLALVNSHIPFVCALTQYAVGLENDEECYLQYLGDVILTDAEKRVLEDVQTFIANNVCVDDVDGLLPVVSVQWNTIVVSFKTIIKKQSNEDDFYQDLKNSIDNGDYVPQRLRRLIGS